MPILSPKKLTENRIFWTKMFVPKLAKIEILLCKWHMAIKTYFKNFLHLLLKNLTSPSKCLHKRRFCEFIPFDMYERLSFYHVSTRGRLFFVNFFFEKNEKKYWVFRKIFEKNEKKIYWVENCYNWDIFLLLSDIHLLLIYSKVCWW